MVVIKPTRDFTSLDRVSYVANNAAKPRQNTAINLYRSEQESGGLIPRKGLVGKTPLEYKDSWRENKAMKLFRPLIPQACNKMFAT